MGETMVKNIRPMLKSDLELVLSWRNHPNIRRFMYTQHKISMREHQDWFKNAVQDDTKHLLIFETTSPLGFINFNISSTTAEWGFYISPNAPRGCGRQLGEASLQYAFETLDIHKVCGQVLAYNDASIRFHEKLGFKHEGELREHYFDGQHYHSVICFGILKNDWVSQNKDRKHD